MIGIVSALSEEIAPLVRRASIRHRERCGTHDVARGQLDGREVALVTVGDGAERAQRGIEAFLAAGEPPRALLFVGIAGGLTPELGPGDLVASQRTCGGAGIDAAGADASLLASALQVTSVHAGTLVTVSRVVTEPAEKHRLRESVRAADPAAVDLESTIFARVASEFGVPHVIVRSISDTVDEGLPRFFTSASFRTGASTVVGSWPVLSCGRRCGPACVDSDPA